MGAAVGLLSSAIPYACDLVALRRLRPDVFSILMCLEPVAAALAGIAVLGEFLSPLQWVAVVSRHGGQHRGDPEPGACRRAGAGLSSGPA